MHFVWTFPWNIDVLAFFFFIFFQFYDDNESFMCLYKLFPFCESFCGRASSSLVKAKSYISFTIHNFNQCYLFLCNRRDADAANQWDAGRGKFLFRIQPLQQSQGFETCKMCLYFLLCIVILRLMRLMSCCRIYIGWTPTCMTWISIILYWTAMCYSDFVHLSV